MAGVLEGLILIPVPGQAGLLPLVQLGLLDPAGLPVAGQEAAAKILDPAIPCPHL